MLVGVNVEYNVRVWVCFYVYGDVDLGLEVNLWYLDVGIICNEGNVI